MLLVPSIQEMTLQSHKIHKYKQMTLNKHHTE